MLGGWVPGTFATQYPAGTGINLPAGNVIVMQVHYNLAGGALPDRTTVRLQYARSAVTAAYIIPHADADFVIPPKATGYTSSQTMDVAFFRRLYGVLPHMHTKGTQVRVDLRQTAAGAYDTCLVDIPRWDFHWQQMYWYENPITLPSSGGSVKLTCTWTNPTDQVITWGEGTNDEMCLNYYYVTF
jgi:hypothetical protein